MATTTSNRRLRPTLAGETVVVPLSGRNLDPSKLEAFLAESEYTV